MMNYKKGIGLSFAAIALCLGRGCQRQAIESKESKQSEIHYDEEDWFSETSDVNTTRIDLNTQNGTVAIQEGGTYIVEGSLSGLMCQCAKIDCVDACGQYQHLVGSKGRTEG